MLRQADQLISNQRPRAEVYAAMAETLGQAWRDVNELLERRKQILDSNVLFQWFVDLFTSKNDFNDFPNNFILTNIKNSLKNWRQIRHTSFHSTLSKFN